VLSPAVEMLDLDPRHLARWWSLLLPPRAATARWAAVFLDQRRGVRHAVRAREGALDPSAVPLTGTSPRALAELRRSLDVDLLAVFADRGTARVAAEIERHLRPQDDVPTQWIALLSALRRLAGDAYWLDPPLHELIPPLSAEPVRRTFELLVPSSSALCAYVFDDAARELHASAIAVVERGEVSLLTTHLALADALPEAELARAWRRDLHRVIDLVDRRLAAPSIGLFAERAAWQRVLVGPADQLTRELAAGHIVLAPAPPWLRGLLGTAQLAAAASGAMRSLAQLIPERARRAASAVAQSAQDRLLQSGAHPFALLGFDPIALWHEIRRAYRA